MHVGPLSLVLGGLYFEQTAADENLHGGIEDVGEGAESEVEERDGGDSQDVAEDAEGSKGESE